MRSVKVAVRKGPDGKPLSMGFGFVECSSEDVAKAVLKQMQVSHRHSQCSATSQAYIQIFIYLLSRSPTAVSTCQVACSFVRTTSACSTSYVLVTVDYYCDIECIVSLSMKYGKSMKWKPPSLTSRLGTHKIGRQIRHSLRQAVRILMLLCLMHICLSILTTALYHLTHACSFFTASLEVSISHYLAQTTNNGTLGSFLSRIPTSLVLLHTTYTCAFKSGCLMSHNWLHTPDCKVLNEKNSAQCVSISLRCLLTPLMSPRDRIIN